MSSSRGAGTEVPDDLRQLASQLGARQPVPGVPPDLRRVVYTTNTIEALNRQIRKTIKIRGQFPIDDAARKLLYLAIINAEKKWHQTYNWTSASAAFKIHFGDRYPH